ncbi:MAG: PAS domain-containing protein [Rhodocyclales bacterium]|nr:PAS domain-containing protein [Rhodocyclales bacterium]
MHVFDASARDQDASALRIVLIYASFAALWILLSDKLVSALLSEPFHVLLASMLKGWLFVAITSLLLYGLIRGRGPKVGAGDTPISRHGTLLLATLAILPLAAAGIGHSFQRQREIQLANLQSIATAKSQQIGDWLIERQGDAELMRISRFVADNFRNWQGGTASAERNLKTHIDSWLELRPYDALSLIDPGGGRRWRSERAPREPAPQLQAALAMASAEHRVVASPPYLDTAGKRRIDFIAPLEFAGPRPALAVLHVDLDKRFLPLVRDWPYPLAGYEAQLLRAEGERLEFLTPIPGEGSGIPAPSPTLKDSGLIAVRAVSDTATEPMMLRGVDHRGAAQIGVVRRVPGTDWRLLIRLGEADLYAAAATDAAWIALSSLLAMFMALTVFVLLRQRDRLGLMSNMVAAREEKLRALQLLDAIAEQSDDAIFAKDLDGRYLLFNRAAAGFVGKPATTVIGKDDRALFPADQAARIQANDQRGIREARVVVSEELLDTVLGPRVFHSTKGPLHDSTGKVIGSFGISRDVTDATRAEEELRQRNEELERFNRATVGRELDMIELKREINRLSRELGRAEPHALDFDRAEGAASAPTKRN